MREVDPFAYYAHHASAIGGFGGGELSPNPLYCLHTYYMDMQAGPAKFEVQMHNVRASFGELMLCVHAQRRDSDENASLVAGSRVDVVTDKPSDLHATIAFFALRNVQYALYGYFDQGSDMRADGVKVVLHESDGEAGDYIEPPRSILASQQMKREVRPANALIHVVPPRLTAPVSQDFTRIQQRELKASGHGESADEWAEALALNALKAFGVTVPALEGVVVGPCSQQFCTALTDARFSIVEVPAEPVPPPDFGLFGDFMVWPQGLGEIDDAAQRWETVKGWFARLKIGGLGMITCRYRPNEIPSASNTAARNINQNEIGRWALRLIGDGYSVAPLAFSAADDLVLDADGLARFALIAKRI
ncbi:hypothetical protein [Novosphingobium sp. FSW06-99]|uniref:hypothetical protein n=1 Tax=Novosphingobium sp. FSW06-99 TaxID=1739113 RepID=UPI00076D91A5|nr:hypothetical protein [Novosphingobium sp. FSW06-99]KUR80715.1 hypothetical protein AQZ49_01405 [Novosphingobium sp. FSW06-99]